MAKFKDTFELVDKVSKPLLKMSRNFAKLDKSIEKSQSKLEKFQKEKCKAEIRNALSVISNKIK